MLINFSTVLISVEQENLFETHNHFLILPVIWHVLLLVTVSSFWQYLTETQVHFFIV